VLQSVKHATQVIYLIVLLVQQTLIKALELALPAHRINIILLEMSFPPANRVVLAALLATTQALTV